MYYDIILRVLRAHREGAVICDDIAETNQCECQCGVKCGDPQPTYGQARDQWLEHVAEMIDHALSN
jgi:uracil-DNA glycosylase